MTGPSAKIILDSVSPWGDRLTTFEINLHRFALPELNTHRLFSRNSASSRAIPVTKTLERVKINPAFPLKWPAEKSGMQGGDELALHDHFAAEDLFEDIHHYAVKRIEEYIAGRPDISTRLHKSLVNRLLEPFMWHTVIISATSYEGFFAQRCSPLAQPEIEAPAQLMRSLYESSTPTVIEPGQWHLPYVTGSNEDIPDLEDRKKISAARAARVSYLSHDGIRDTGADLALYDRLVSADPPHWSPLEHVATPERDWNLGNFKGWEQLRFMLEWKRERGIDD